MDATKFEVSGDEFADGAHAVEITHEVPDCFWSHEFPGAAGLAELVSLAEEHERTCALTKRC
jgi:hypothetical protein